MFGFYFRIIEETEHLQFLNQEIVNANCLPTVDTLLNSTEERYCRCRRINLER